MEHLRIQAEGYDAYQRYEPKEANPHPPHTLRHKWWLMGWEEAKYEHYEHWPRAIGALPLEAT